jgi:hypothetical protein
VALDGYGCQASGPFNQANFIEEGTIPPLLAIVAWPVGSSSPKRHTAGNRTKQWFFLPQQILNFGSRIMVRNGYP